MAALHPFDYATAAMVQKKCEKIEIYILKKHYLQRTSGEKGKKKNSNFSLIHTAAAGAG
jgi:hypothetical protein